MPGSGLRLLSRQRTASLDSGWPFDSILPVNRARGLSVYQCKTYAYTYIMMSELLLLLYNSRQ